MTENEEKIEGIIHDIRVLMSCCCSELRGRKVNKLLDELETILKEDV